MPRFSSPPLLLHFHLSVFLPSLSPVGFSPAFHLASSVFPPLSYGIVLSPSLPVLVSFPVNTRAYPEIRRVLIRPFKLKRQCRYYDQGLH